MRIRIAADAARVILMADPCACGARPTFVQDTQDEACYFMCETCEWEGEKDSKTLDGAVIAWNGRGPSSPPDPTLIEDALDADFTG